MDPQILAAIIGGLATVVSSVIAVVLTKGMSDRARRDRRRIGNAAAASPAPAAAAAEPKISLRRRLAIGGTLLVVVAATALAVLRPWEPINFFDYFPMEVGANWFYSVEIGDQRPQVYRESFWPSDKRSKPGAVFGVGLRGFPSDMLRPEKEWQKTYFVRLMVAADEPIRNRADWALSRKISIDLDNLGYYGRPKSMVWSLTTKGTASGFTVFDQRVCSEENGPHGVPVEGDGTDERLLFVGLKWHGQVGVHRIGGKDPIEHLDYLGLDRDVPEHEGVPCVHLRRKLAASDDKAKDELSKGWTEDCWYAKEKGMVRLVQKIDGRPSMTWRLQQMFRGGQLDQVKVPWWTHWQALAALGVAVVGTLVMMRLWWIRQ